MVQVHPKASVVPTLSVSKSDIYAGNPATCKKSSSNALEFL
jgi:hypothetical protein